MMRSAVRTSLALLLALSLCACADWKPTGFKYDPPAPVTNASFFTFHASVVNRKGEELKGRTVSYGGGPKEILEVSPAGNLRCAKSGDATLTLMGYGLNEQVPLKCRVPTEIAMPPELEVVMNGPPAPLHVQALGDGEKPLDSVAIAFTSSDPAVLTVEGDTPKGVAVGKARLTGSAGGITGVSAVDVVEAIVVEPITLKDGASRTIELKTEGNYRVIVELKTDERLKQGVTVSWTGTACDNQPEAASQRQVCRVSEPATVTITNPKLMGLGATVTGTLKVHRVPG